MRVGPSFVLIAALASAARGQADGGRAESFIRNLTQSATQPATLPAGRPATRATTMPAGMKMYPTPYYILYTDVSEQEAREADLRLTRMFEEYQRRTAEFAGQVKEKFPFYLFRNEADYNVARGPKKSAGVYIESHDGTKKLMAIAGDKTDDYTWSVVQHEGFHQFVAATIKYDLPTWANEGLAEYFGEGQWTGDGFVTGLIPAHRLEKVRQGIKSGFKPFKDLMKMTDKEWIADLTGENYDEAWSMIHFLAHADNGKYQQPFINYMKAISKGVAPQQAWDTNIDPNTEAFQKRYSDWWLALPDRPTQMGYIQVMMQTETSFLARAYLAKQNFPDVPTFLKNYKPPDFVNNRDLWLPPSLFTGFSDMAPDMGTWTFVNGPTPRLVLKLGDGTVFTGTFVVANGKVWKVTVDMTAAPAGRGR